MKLNDKLEKLFKTFQRANIDQKEIERARVTVGVLGEIADDFMLRINMVENVIKGNYKISLLNLSMLIGAIIYVINPVDVIPDIIPIFGWLDDVAVVTFIINQHSTLLENYRKFISKKNEEVKNYEFD